MKRKHIERRVSLWAGFERHANDVDILKDLCRVSHYSLDYQEILVDDRKWKIQPIKTLIGKLSYASTFQADALAAAKKLDISKALFVVAQFDFEYNPAKVRKKIAPDPVFLGCFTYDDSEDDERNQEYLDAMNRDDDEDS